MKPLIRITSDGHPDGTEVCWIETGEIIPVVGLVFNMRVDQMGVVLLEIPSPAVNFDIYCKKYLFHKMENKKEMYRLGLGRINCCVL